MRQKKPGNVQLNCAFKCHLMLRQPNSSGRVLGIHQLQAYNNHHLLITNVFGLSANRHFAVAINHEHAIDCYFIDSA